MGGEEDGENERGRERERVWMEKRERRGREGGWRGAFSGENGRLGMKQSTLS